MIVKNIINKNKKFLMMKKRGNMKADFVYFGKTPKGALKVGYISGMGNNQKDLRVVTQIAKLDEDGEYRTRDGWYIEKRNLNIHSKLKIY